MLKATPEIAKLSLVYAVIGSLLLPSTSYAYVDPGSGSVIVTTVLGLVAAIGYTFRKFFYNLRARLFKIKNPDEDRSLDD